ncbi:hypothetical protein EZV73_05790 [Acidaminobacter sp. JC074]|uniref:M56 family metallopeptidase n=1 Tax=Acidaminobacter sp. JC074 TaxID=2530199 RepID=UPI001F0E083A|nr:M56 family metallopeptidase [Acidaminobacter sp. JC074]MCH4887070.1 hypothetical protein [Acidaminobacter sp. JC074]
MIGAVFSRVLSLSITGSIIVVLTMLLKMLFKKKFSARWHYLIWFVLIIKLMMPIDIESPVSVMPNIDLESTPLSVTTDEGVTETPEPVMETKARPVKSLTYIHYIWFTIVVLIVTIKTILEGIFLRKQKIRKLELPMMDKLLSELKEELKIKGKVSLWLDKEDSVARVYGVLRPRIILTEKILYSSDESRLRYILLHELAHVKNHDILINMVRHLLMSLYFFNPIILLGLKQMAKDCELACDEAVLSRLTPNEQIGYGHTLISLINKKRPPNSLAMSLVKKKDIVRRLKMIQSYKKASKLSKVLSIVLASGFITTCLLVPQVSAEYQAPHKEFVFSLPEESVTVETPVEVLEESLEFIFPTETARITAPYGERLHPITKEKFFHKGIDIAAITGTDIYASEKGEVVYADWMSEYGKIIIIEHKDGYKTLYAHCSKLLVYEGDTVDKNQVIATVGNTGQTTGPHLHFEIRNDDEPVDPMTILK